MRYHHLLAMRFLRYARIVGTALALLVPSTVLAQTETVVYFHTDAVGSVRMVTDANGTVIAEYDYWPFGVPVQSSTETRRFAGAERDAETGSDYLGARYDQAHIGRFTTPDDTSYMDPFDPQSMNRYAYAYNNPLRYVDPTGHSGDCVAGFDAETGKCKPAPIPFLWADWFQHWGTAARVVAQPVVDWVTAPRDPACMGTLMMGGAAAGTAVGGGVGVITGPGEAVMIPVGALTGAVRGVAVGLGMCMSSTSGGTGGGGFKNPKAGVSGKEGAKDVPSWAKGQKPKIGEDGKTFAERLLDAQYGKGNWQKGPRTEFNQIQKWGDRAFE